MCGRSVYVAITSVVSSINADSPFCELRGTSGGRALCFFVEAGGVCGGGVWRVTMPIKRVPGSYTGFPKKKNGLVTASERAHDVVAAVLKYDGAAKISTISCEYEGREPLPSPNGYTLRCTGNFWGRWKKKWPWLCFASTRGPTYSYAPRVFRLSYGTRTN